MLWNVVRMTTKHCLLCAYCMQWDIMMVGFMFYINAGYFVFCNLMNNT